MEEKKVSFLKRVIDYLYLFQFEVDTSLFIACQFALESNWGTSELALKKNNFCGMKKPMVRISTASNAGKLDGDLFACYSSFEACVLDYILWLQFQKPLRKQLDNVSLFPSLLKSYCPEKDYIDKINQIYKQFKSLNHE